MQCELVNMDLSYDDSFHSSNGRLTFVIALSAGSQAPSRSCTNNWMQLEMMLEKKQRFSDKPTPVKQFYAVSDGQLVHLKKTIYELHR